MIRSLAVVSALALTVAAAPVAAQLPFRFGVQAGASIPTGDFGDNFAKMGYNVGLLAEVKPVLLPVGVRADVGFHEFALEGEDGEDSDFDFRLLNVNANAILEMPGIGLKPYLLGGLGWYQGYVRSGSDDFDDSEKESAIGFNVGAGIRFGLAGFGAAVETHYRSANIDFGGDEELKLRFVPISFVLTF